MRFSWLLVDPVVDVLIALQSFAAATITMLSGVALEMMRPVGGGRRRAGVVTEATAERGPKMVEPAETRPATACTP